MFTVKSFLAKIFKLAFVAFVITLCASAHTLFIPFHSVLLCGTSGSWK